MLLSKAAYAQADGVAAAQCQGKDTDARRRDGAALDRAVEPWSADRQARPEPVPGWPDLAGRRASALARSDARWH